MTKIDQHQRFMPDQMIRKVVRLSPAWEAIIDPANACLKVTLHLMHMRNGVGCPHIQGLGCDRRLAASKCLVIDTALLESKGLHANNKAAPRMVLRPVG